MKPFLVTDGVNWVRVDRDEMAFLLGRREIHVCSGECGDSVLHPMNSIPAVERALEDWEARRWKDRKCSQKD